MKKSSKRYIPQGYGPSKVKYDKFFDEKSKMMWSIICKRKIHYERWIHKNDYEKIKIYKMLNDRCLFGTIYIAKLFNRDIV